MYKVIINASVLEDIWGLATHTVNHLQLPFQLCFSQCFCAVATQSTISNKRIWTKQYVPFLNNKILHHNWEALCGFL